MKGQDKIKLGIISLILAVVAVLFYNGNIVNSATYNSERYVDYCEEIGAEYHISPELLEALIEYKSGGDPNFHNGKYYGLLGIDITKNNDRIARLGISDIYDEYGNIQVGADYLLELFEEYEDLYYVLNIYEGLPLNSTEFAQDIAQRVYDLEELHGKHDY